MFRLHRSLKVLTLARLKITKREGRGLRVLAVRNALKLTEIQRKSLKVFQKAPAVEAIPAKAQNPTQDRAQGPTQGPAQGPVQCPTQGPAQDLVQDHDPVEVPVLYKVKAAAILAIALANHEEAANISQKSSQHKRSSNQNPYP